MIDKTIELTFEELKELLIRAGKNGFNSYETNEAGLEYYDAEVDALWIMRGSEKKDEKYLDKDDIEELGWTYKGKHHFYRQDEWYEIHGDEYSNYYLHKYNEPYIGRGRFTIIQASPNGYSLSGDDAILFDGEIRNYNELKFLMRRLNIINN